MKRVSSSQNHKLHEILKNLQSLNSEYPEDLLSARRAAFLDQLAENKVAEAKEESTVDDQKVIDLLHRLQYVSMEYPPQKKAARRSAYMRKILWMNWVGFWTDLWNFVQEKISIPDIPSRVFSASLLTTSLVLAAVAGILFYQNHTTLSGLVNPQHGIVRSAHIISSDTRVVKISCKPGLKPPLCLVGEYGNDNGLAVQGVGKARPAVAKDSMPGPGNHYLAAYVNDGRYGPGTSWRSNSKNSWIKIDLGRPAEINTVTFGKDRLGKLADGDPGQFIVSLALYDDVYANGNNHNDNREYTQVYDSRLAGFDGVISGTQTVKAQFNPQMARYIKITFENKGTSIDEIEAFFVQQSAATNKTKKDNKDKQPRPTATFVPTSTSVPVDTATTIPTATDTATPVPTDTPVPTYTPTDTPTSTPVPTDTSTPTRTPRPTHTPTPTNTPTPRPTRTPTPTDTPTPVPTDTPLPTSTALPTDTATPVDTNTPLPMPTDTQLPDTATTIPSQGSTFGQIP